MQQGKTIFLHTLKQLHRRSKLKTKLLFLSAVIVGFLTVLSLLVLQTEFEHRSYLLGVQKNITHAKALSEVIHALQTERGLISGLLASDGSKKYEQKLAAARDKADRTISSAVSVYSNTEDASPATLNLLQTIKKERKKIGFKSRSIDRANAYYTKHIATLLDISKKITLKMRGKTNRNTLHSYINLACAKESLEQIRANLHEAFVKKTFSDAILYSFTAQLKMYYFCLQSFKTIAHSDTLHFYEQTLHNDTAAQTFAIIENLQQQKKRYEDFIDPGSWFFLATGTMNMFHSVQKQIFTQINANLDKNITFSTYKIIGLSLFLFFIIAVLIVMTAVLISDIIARTKNLQQKHDDSLLLMRQYKTAMDKSFIVSKTDPNGFITYVNEEFCKISGYTKAELIGRPHNIIRHPNTPKETFKTLWDTIKKRKQPWNGEIENLNKDHSSYWVKAVIHPILDKDGNILEFIGIRTNITEVKKASMIDFLTGYGNRTKLNKDIQTLSNPCLAVFNLDNFRQVNDFYGHAFGDKTIQTIAHTIHDYTIEDERLLFYRLQGDEFVILANGYSKLRFENLAQEIIHRLKDGATIEKEEILISCSCGISFESTKDKLLSTANMALAIAKKSNSRYIVYNENTVRLNEKYENNIRWSKKLNYAIANDDIVTFYQPIVNNKTGGYEKYECLVRIQDHGKIVSPFFFLEVAKQTRQYFTITQTVIAQAFETFKHSGAQFSINLSILDIAHESMVEYIIFMLESYDIGQRVVFEIVESEYIDNFENVMRFIDSVKKYGCKIAIDDFGTGYSNFEYLIKFHADFLKIDGSLIKDIDTDQNKYLVVESIVHFCQKLQMKTIAEFIENESIFKTVRELGIDYSQGYYFSRPKATL